MHIRYYPDFRDPKPDTEILVHKRAGRISEKYLSVRIGAKKFGLYFYSFLAVRVVCIGIIMQMLKKSIRYAFM